MRRIGASVIERVTQACVCASMLLAPVAATQAATEEDPWEAVNRPIFRFNDTLDTYALKPLAKGYEAVTPQFLEDGIHNVFRNLGDVTNLVNNVLQLKPHAAGVDTARLIVNTTFGLVRRIEMNPEGRAILEYEAGMHMCHSGGVVQGGFVTGWIDAAMAHAAMAMTGPGCGGIRPCMTERNESSGRTSSRKGLPVSLARVMTIGRMSSRPTAESTKSASRH